MPPLACLDGNAALSYNFYDEAILPLPDQDSNDWGARRSSSLYRVDCWGTPYFFVNGEGNIAVRPHGKDTKPNEEIDIMMAMKRVVESKLLGESDLPSPVIVRFPDVLKDRLESLQSAFDSAIRSKSYHGRFQGVFPIKCNQDRFVVENVVEFGKPYGFGLEAGSKPELLLAMASLPKGSPEALLICNGYKDADYVCLALIAMHLGLNCVIVLEQEGELDVVLKMSRLLCIEPIIGLRAKLNTKHAGHFGETSGEKGKFGLSCSKIVEIAQKLRRVGMLGCLQLLHFHIGSQIPSLAILNDGISEAAHIYCELALMGANMRFIDIGGGLGIDYDGSNCAQSDMSVGYTMEAYAEEVVLAVKKACAMKSVKHPTLCSESGRALVSHHSVLIFDVLSAEERGGKLAREVGVPLEVEQVGLPEELSLLQRSLIGYVRRNDYANSLKCAKELKLGCAELFKQGKLSLMLLARINSQFEVVSAWVAENRRENNALVTHYRSAIYHINLSIFRSMPDTWAIGQLFPIVPLHRLEEQPTVRAILSDLTCDSDGKIETFIGTDANGKRMNYLPVHPLEEGKPYYMGMFLGGAYQEALGSLHNLFGTPPVVQVVLNGPKSFTITKASAGQSASDVLSSMQHQPLAMLESLKLRVHQCFLGHDQDSLKTALTHSLACSFASSTYLSTNNVNSSPFAGHLFRPKSSVMVSDQHACCCT